MLPEGVPGAVGPDDGCRGRTIHNHLRPVRVRRTHRHAPHPQQQQRAQNFHETIVTTAATAPPPPPPTHTLCTRTHPILAVCSGPRAREGQIRLAARLRKRRTQNARANRTRRRVGGVRALHDAGGRVSRDWPARDHSGTPETHADPGGCALSGERPRRRAARRAPRERVKRQSAVHARGVRHPLQRESAREGHRDQREARGGPGDGALAAGAALAPPARAVAVLARRARSAARVCGLARQRPVMAALAIAAANASCPRSSAPVPPSGTRYAAG